MSISTETLAEIANNLEREKTTPACKLSDGRTVTVSQLRAAFERMECPDHWKNGFCAVVESADVDLAIHAVLFFHGGRPRVEWIDNGKRARIISHGYAC